MTRLLLLGVLALAGCGDRPAQSKAPEVFTIIASASAHSYPDVIRDNETGCQYIRIGSITPRISPDGKTHMGCREGAK